MTLQERAVAVYGVDFEKLPKDTQESVRRDCVSLASDDMLTALEEAWLPWQRLLNEGKIGVGGYPASLAKAKSAIDKAKGLK